MGRHSKTEGSQPVDGQALADSFDEQFANSTGRSEEKVQAGTYPYDFGAASQEDNG